MTLIDVTSSPDTGMPGPSPSACRLGDAAPSHPWTRRSDGTWKWVTRNDWIRALHSNGHPDWACLQGHGGAVLVKANDGRQVWRVQLGDKLVFVKLYLPLRGWGRMRRLLLGSDSMRERRVAEYARQHRIATVQPIASADAPASGSRPVSILITEGLARACPLNEVWPGLDQRGRENRRLKNTIIDRVARLIAHAHQNGFEHTDLHAGNILIDRSSDGECQALFVDLHNIRLGRPVSDRAVVRNLAQFHQWFRFRAPLTDRLRFLDRYLEWRKVLEPAAAYGRPLGRNRDDLRAAIERMAESHAGALYAKRDRRAARNGRYFARIRVGKGWRGHAFLRCKQPLPGSSASLRTFTAEQWKDWLCDPKRWTRTEQSQYAIKKSASGMVCRSRLSVDNDPLDVICKRSTPRHLGKRIKNLFRESRAMRTWRLANALLNRQIATARPLAIMERRRAGFLLDSLILTEYIEHAHDLDTLLTVQIRDMEAGQQNAIKRQVSDALASLFKAFHGRGFVHRDLKAPNVMVQWDPAGSAAPRILLVDLDGVRQVRRVRRRDWIRALMRLNVSIDHCRRITRTDRLRFLKSCLVRPGNPDPQWRDAWSEIAVLSERKREHKTRQFEKMMARYGRI
jgi:serine/threonine protein kinase